MSDDVDRTQERLELEEKIRKQYQAKPIEIKGTGFCLNCGELVKGDRRWCNADCMADYERFMSRKSAGKK